MRSSAPRSGSSLLLPVGVGSTPTLAEEEIVGIPKPYRYWTHAEKKQHNTGVNLPSAIGTGIPLCFTSANRRDTDTVMKVVTFAMVGIRPNSTDLAATLPKDWANLSFANQLVGWSPIEDGAWVQLTEGVPPSDVLGIYPMVQSNYTGKDSTHDFGASWRSPLVDITESRRAGLEFSGGFPTVYTSFEYFSADAVGSAVGGFNIEWVLHAQLRVLWASADPPP